MAPRKLKLPIPCQVIVGQLNSGKTSTILQMLACKPKDEVWACLVNEAGAVGIDQALLSGSISSVGGGGSVVRELAGGCLCCALSTVTSAALVQLIRSTKPDMLIIEPSGLAHPKALLEMLQSQHLKTALDLRPIVCLVDLSTFSPSILETQDNEESMFAAQLGIADILIATKADLCTAQQIDIFSSWAASLHPPKRKYLACSSSEIELSDLGIASDSAADGGEILSTSSREPPAGEVPIPPIQSARDFLKPVGKKVWLSNAAKSNEPSPGKPIRKESPPGSTGASTCGWIFHTSEVFNSQALEKFVRGAQAYILRLKGIFRIEKEPPRWVLVSIGRTVDPTISNASLKATREPNRDAASCSGSGGESAIATDLLQELPGAHADSRIEFIVSESGTPTDNAGEMSDIGQALMAKDWERVENLLIELLVTK